MLILPVNNGGMRRLTEDGETTTECCSCMNSWESPNGVSWEALFNYGKLTNASSCVNILEMIILPLMSVILLLKTVVLLVVTEYQLENQFCVVDPTADDCMPSGVDFSNANLW